MGMYTYTYIHMTRVHFDPTVTIREMDVSREEHVKEIKNPQNIIEVVEKLTEPEHPTTKHSHWLLIIVVIIIIAFISVIIYKKRSCLRQKTESKPI
jgi:hypothetical protein